MNKERWELIKELHARALDVSEDVRIPFLLRECGSDTALFDELTQMLWRQKQGESFLEPPFAPGIGVEEDDEGRDEMVGRTLGEDFELLRRLGSGGMGIVYLAYQISLKREVAVKVLPARSTLEPRHVERFLREAHAAAKLQHPGIVAIHEVGPSTSGIHFFAMDYIRGRDLAKELALLRDGNEDGVEQILPPFGARDYIPVVARLCASVAEALEYAHGNGVVHRDVKPNNLLLDPRGGVHVVDFGLAKVEELGSISKAGDLAGTVWYMSPEQALAKRVKVDHRTDVYSLGVVLYEMLALRRPFEGESAQEVLFQVSFREARGVRRLNPRVPRDLEVICEKALSKAPADRYATAGEFAADLHRFLNHEQITARRPPLWRRAQRHLIRRRAIYQPAAAVLLTIAIGLFVAHSLITGAYPRVTFAAEASLPGTEVYLQPIDWLTRDVATPHFLGSWPLEESIAVSPGMYRFVLVRQLEGEASTAELTRSLDQEGADYSLDPGRLSPVDSPTAMVLVPGGTYRVGDPGSARLPQFMERDVELTPFWIDETEVTNAQYREFVALTGRQTLPLTWEDGYDAAWNDLPVAGVTFEDAQAYAEWTGKRLPTQYEWEAAARGPMGSIFPWGDDDTDLAERAVVGRTELEYPAGVQPVGTSVGDRSEFGALDMLGNVSEWTETVHVTLKEDGELYPDLGSRVVKGQQWSDEIAPPTNLIETCVAPIVGREAFGFRCAKSAWMP